jgi:hypothetical protein
MRKQFFTTHKKLYQYVTIFLFLAVTIWISVKAITLDKSNHMKDQNTNERVKYANETRLHTPEEFGANGFDRKTDTVALQKAIDSSDTLVLKSGATYIINRPLVSSHSIEIEGNNTTKKAPVILQVSKQSAFILNNEQTASTIVVKKITNNTPYITVASTKGLKPGDLLHLISSKLWFWDNRGYLKKGELHKITKINGDKVYLDRNTSDNYFVGEGEVVSVKVYPNVSLKLSNISFSHPKPYKTIMIKVNNTSNTKIENVSVRNAKRIGIILNCTFQTEVNKANINLGTTKDITSGYGIQDYGGTGTLVTDSIFRRVRRGVDFSGVTPSRYGMVSNSKAYGYKQDTLASGNSGFGTHSTAENITFENNYVENFNHAILSRGENITVKGNTSEGFSRSFIVISYGKNVKVLNNTYKSKNDRYIDSFILLTGTYRGSLIVSGNKLIGKKSQFIKGEIGQIDYALIKGNSIKVE